jgi:hypothetical protein
MKVRLIGLFSLLLLLKNNAPAIAAISITPANTAASVIIPPAVLQKMAHLKIKEIEKLTGRKLRWKEKLAVKIYQWKIRRDTRHKKTGDITERGTTAMIFAIIGLGLLFIPIPYLGGLGAIASMITALVVGYQAKKANPNDKRAKTAILLGWIGIGLVVLAVVILVVLLAATLGGL